VGLTLDEIKALLPALPDDRTQIEQLHEVAGRKHREQNLTLRLAALFISVTELELLLSQT
jgi:hypothetical protein